MYECHRSGVCCQIDKSVSPQELAEMIQAGPMYAPLNATKEGNLIVVAGRCPWYEDGCTIYSHRPAVCRGYLCFRKKADDPFRSIPEQVDFMEQNPDAVAQARSMRENAMEYARKHGWKDI